MGIEIDQQTGERRTLSAGTYASFLPNLSDDELRSLAREKLSQALQAIDPTSQPELTRKLCAEVKDRLDGKPMQSQQTLLAVADASKPSFITILGQLDGRSSGLPEIEG